MAAAWLTASRLISSPSRPPLAPSAGSSLAGTVVGGTKVPPPSLDHANPSPRGGPPGAGNISQRTYGLPLPSTLSAGKLVLPNGAPRGRAISLGASKLRP